MYSMYILVKHPEAVGDSDIRNMDVRLPDVDAMSYRTEIDDRYEYLDTPFGSFRRSVNYWIHSPHGWCSVSWG